MLSGYLALVLTFQLVIATSRLFLEKMPLLLGRPMRSVFRRWKWMRARLTVAPEGCL